MRQTAQLVRPWLPDRDGPIMFMRSVVAVLSALLIAACGSDTPDTPDAAPVTYRVGGTVTGLVGSGLVLQNQGGDDLPIGADGAFVFSTRVAAGGAYAITVLQQPTGQICTVSNGAGAVQAADVTDVVVACACGPDGPGPDEVLADTTDPADGVFSLEEALVDLPPGSGPLRAIITTEEGAFTCTLEPTLTPNAVANFVGLARGRRPWLDPVTHKWVKRRFYDGLKFHRIIDNFVIQGGDPLGTGYGGPGYKFADEITTLVHVPGALAYANAGANTNGSQIYITEVALPSLDGDYTVFGTCAPLSVIQTLAALPTDANDKPLTDVHMLSVEITRCPLD